MNRQDFYFDLPENLIAQVPLENRASSKLMIVNKKSGEISHENFENIINHIDEGDCIVLNNTKVIPARLFGERKETGGKVEILLLRQLSDDSWEVLVNPGKKARIGDEIIFKDGILSGKIIDIIEDGKRIIKFEYVGIFQEVLDALGEMPLPPYIHEKLEDNDRYQTVYAKERGSVAAPTAGLHFTEEILKKIEEKKIKIAHVTLHVGLGTFRPVKADNIFEHQMHSEYYHLEESQAEIINECKKNNKKIIAVGTTSCRVLETCGADNGILRSGIGDTDIFIYPGYKFKVVDNLITNFHLPESTLLMLVSALSSREIILKAYDEAIKNEYRFFSFGDSMFITD